MVLSIIIPVYNSEKIISLVVEELRKTLSDKLAYEIILINDGSKDDSYNVCRRLSKKYGFVRFIDLSKNFGQHSAILAGLRFVKGEYIVFMDDDLQTPPREIWKLINKIKEGYDVVYAKYESKQHSRFKTFGSKINDIMANILFKKPKNINITSYFIIRKYLADEITNYTGPYPYLGGLIFRSTDNIGTVDMAHDRREYGKSNYSFISLFKLWFNGFTNFSVKPLRVSFLLGTICSLAGFISSIVIVIRKIINPQIVLGWTSMIVAVLLFSGIQLILIGLVGEYVGRIFLSQNKQPQYVIKEKYNIKDD
jgi:glycosyltransferase involved in cell wall biosynthesis